MSSIAGRDKQQGNHWRNHNTNPQQYEHLLHHTAHLAAGVAEVLPKTRVPSFPAGACLALLLTKGRQSGMGCNSLASNEQLDRIGRNPCLDRLAGQMEGHAVISAVDIDVVIKASPADASFGVDIILGWKRPEMRPVHGLEEGATRHLKTADPELVIETDEGSADRAIEFGE
jgi:hypothetical protein